MENLAPDLKRKLKSIRSHLDSRCDQKAKELIEELLDEGVRDYFLYLFAAVVYSREDNVMKAFEFYKEAVKVDSNHASAWQGIFKLYENGDLRFDDYAVTALDKLIALTPEEKRLSLQKKRADVLLSLQKYDVILADEQLMNDEEFCSCAICSIVNNEKKYSDIERALCDRCFRRLESCHDSEILDLKIAQYNCALAESVSEIRAEVLKYVNHCTSSSWDSWGMRQMRFVLGINYFNSHDIDTEMCDTIKKVKQTSFEILYTYIIKKDIVAALNYINSLSEDEYDWPLLMLMVPTLLRHEHYERVLSLLDKPLPVMFDAFEAESERAIAAARMEALYNIGDEKSLRRLQILMETCSYNRFSKAISLKLLCCRQDSTLETLEDAFNAHPIVSEEDRRYWRAVLTKEHNNLGDAKVLAEAALAANSESWRKMLLLAEILLVADSSDKKATSLLVKAAKLNPCNSRIFLLLGESLVSINRQKALQCVDRARRIRPQSLDVAKLYDRLLGLEGKKEEQLNYICQYLDINPSSDWALRRRALLKMDLEKIDEAVEDLQKIMRKEPQDIVIWNALAEAYRRRGNLQSSIKAFNAIIEMDRSSYNAHINLIQIYHMTGQLEDAVERCKLVGELFKVHPPENHYVNCILLLHASSLLKLAQQSPHSQQFLLLNQIFDFIEEVIAKNKTFATSFKIAADALMLSSRFHVKTFKKLIFPPSWAILTPTDALNLAAQFYCTVVKICPTWAGSWNDLGIALTKKSKKTKESSLAIKAKICFKRAIVLCKYPHVKSTYWANMSQAVDLLGNKLHTQHCLIRALQLNRKNDRAWCLLGLFYLQNQISSLAKQALDIAQNCNPELAEMWCAMAMLAETENHYDTMDLFRHSLTLKPSELGIKKYAYYMMQKYKEGKCSDSATMFGFESLHEYYGISSRSDELKFYLALLAEHFWCLKEAKHYIQNCDSFPIKALNKIHSERIEVRMHGETSIGCDSSTLKQFAAMLMLTAQEIYNELCDLCPIYKKLFQAIDEQDSSKFCECFINEQEHVSIPVLVGATITFKKRLTDEMLNALDDVRPHHQLIDVFPPDRITNVNDELSYDIQGQGEKPLVRHDNLSKHLRDLLFQKKQYCEARYYKENVIKDPYIEKSLTTAEEHDI